MVAKKPSIVVLYQFFPPDDVVSAILFGDLSSGLVEHGWRVQAYPCVWSCRDERLRYSRRDEWRGIAVRRIWRPKFPQSSNLGRLLSAVWMLGRWSFLPLTLRPRPDVLLVGTDPILSLLVAFAWRLFSPSTKIAHWCLDLYPEAAVADGMLPPNGFFVRGVSRLLRLAYRRCALIADLGPCMRRRLMRYSSTAHRETIVPWAIDEPDAPLPISAVERAALFGDARLAVLYSGSFGRAHSYAEILEFAALIRQRGGKLVFSVRGNRQEELRQAIRKTDANAEVAPFAASGALPERLACADIHVVTLRPEWTGMVVPSKFFGSLAAGRPVLFAGSPDSSVAQWIKEFQLGWVLTQDNLHQVSERILEYIDSPEQVDSMQRRCFLAYQENFSRRLQLDRLNFSLQSLLGQR